MDGPSKVRTFFDVSRILIELKTPIIVSRDIALMVDADSLVTIHVDRSRSSSMSDVRILAGNIPVVMIARWIHRGRAKLKIAGI